mmetsp:Transcript_11457/g.37651  ORF Transcript_11457/g.37651 Transcript_11457/m.37651 type:complete len:200 (-) Transcript_11457:74-673(-)
MADDEALPQRPPRAKRARLHAPVEAEPEPEAEAGPSEQTGPSAAIATFGDLVPKYEYQDHTADIQLHAWGDKLEEAFAWTAIAMFNYMTPLEQIGVNESLTREYSVKAHDMQSLLFAFLDELLFVFSTEFFSIRELELVKLDRENFAITAIGRGETFSLDKHVQGTEVKAITYSNMQIHERAAEGDKPASAEIYVIVDI